MTYDEITTHYTWLHANSRYGYFPQDLARAKAVYDFLIAQLSPGDSVIDCSAGRGLLLSALQKQDIRCFATEIDPRLCENELREFSPHCLRYDQLATLQPKKFDAVVSIDVLEHLFTEDEVRLALRDLAALSRQWLCVSVGMMPSSWACEDGKTVQLHYVVKEADWWDAAVGEVAAIASATTLNRSRVIFAEVTR